MSSKQSFSAKCHKRDLAILGEIIPNQRGKPAFQCFRLSSTDGHMIVEAQGDEHAVRLSLPIEAAGGPVLVNAKWFHAAVNAIDADLEISEGDARIILKDANSIMRLHVETHDFPELNFDRKGFDGKIGSADLLRLIKSSAFSAANEMNRYAINAPCLEFSEGSIRAVATNGRSLSYAAAAWAGGKLDRLLVPTQLFGMLAKLVTPDDEISIWRRKDYVGFSGKNFELCGTDTQGDFPPYQSVIPTETPINVTVARIAFIAAIGKAATFSTEYGETGLVMEFSNGGGIRISHRSAEIGDASVTIPAKVSGALRICFRPDLILPILNAIDADEVEIGMIADNRPAKFVGGGVTAMLMPVMVNQ